MEDDNKAMKYYDDAENFYYKSAELGNRKAMTYLRERFEGYDHFISNEDYDEEIN